MKTPKSYEEATARIEELLLILQNENTSLNDAVKAYGEAAALISACEEMLDTAKVKLDEIDVKCFPHNNGDKNGLSETI